MTNEFHSEEQEDAFAFAAFKRDSEHEPFPASEIVAFDEAVRFEASANIEEE